MFSSLSNFLPAALHSSSSPVKSDLIREDDDDDDPGNKSDASRADDIGVLKKKKDKSANETFIFVRPPPAKTNHPLNLQVQLVPPNSRGPSGLTSASRQSLDLSASAPATPADSAPTTPVDASAPPLTSAPTAERPSYDSGAPLTRTESNRSTASSTYSSTSTASTSSNASSRRMIVPLYNLQAHNVMTNIIVDAGTDAKIARFTKRGIEMLELAVLEPVEVYPGGGAPTGEGGVPIGGSSGFSNRGVVGRPSMTAMNAAGVGASLTVPGANGGGGSRPGTPDPTSSQASLLTSSSAHSHSHSQHERPLSWHEPGQAAAAATTPGTPQSKRKLFGNLFKRKDAPATPGTPEGTPTPTATPSGHARTRSAVGVRPASPSTGGATSLALPRTSISSVSGHGHRSSVDLARDDAALPAPVVGRQPILGLLASISSPVHPPKGRPGLGMVRGQHGADGDLTGEVEMRFEWKRGKAKRRREKEREREKGEGENGSVASRRKPSTGNLTPQKRLSLSVISRQSSFSTTAGASEEGYLDAAARRRPSVAPGDGEDSGDESDPEDSETPWTCTVKVRRIAAPHARGHSHSHSFGSGRHNPEQEQQEQEQGEQDRARWKKEVLRIKVGTLSPTPHHPKVVAMLKVPFPLPDVDVERLVVHKRDAPRPGESVSPPGVKGGHGLLITAEEIKDVVCSTGLWLVVREGFGGIGKVSRKGDGWRLRG
ncbi:hypothetical protein B0H14DRAFT_3490255 [Mycena olivaceomarginata]|nr:hypothetical protein B0H14DRAFT_3490255 [Mycena olivaceomarginata]